MKDRINYIIFLPLIFLAFFLQTTFFAQLFSGNLIPPLVFMVLTAAVFLSDSYDFLYLALFFGFLFDIFTGSSFGIFTASFAMAAAAAFILKENFLKDPGFTKTVLLSAAVAVAYNLTYLLLSVVFSSFGFLAHYGPIIHKTAYDAVLAAIFVYPAMHLISNKKQ